MHDSGVRILHLASRKTDPVFQGEAPFYKAMSISVRPAWWRCSGPATIRAAGPMGLEVWRLTYR